jgi:succinate dehydrogenase flavin-adding protein (antitoxin of CptAB toxin-antitoxin module)
VSDLLNKAKFKARRGLNELDKIFVPFVEKRFISLNTSQVDQLFELFEIDDVSLADMIIYKKMDYPNELNEIFEEIFEFYSEI